MKFVVGHDEAGNILSVFSDEEAASHLEIEGETLTEAEGPDVDETKPEELVRIMQRFKVDRAEGRAQLVEKELMH